jgi:hypothetical protein
MIVARNLRRNRPEPANGVLVKRDFFSRAPVVPQKSAFAE